LIDRFPSLCSEYTSEEKLGQEDAYHCPQCNQKREAVKRLGVWSVPDVLVIHLKRFRHQSTVPTTTSKLETRVDFPLEGFDMSPNMAPRGGGGQLAPSQRSGETRNYSSVTSLQMLSSAFSPWKHPRRYQQRSNNNNNNSGTERAVEDTMYELYSVCNHHGSDLQGGHYTATCRNPTDGQWYSFDDMHTRRISEAEVVTKNAYILFYQKTCLSTTAPHSSNSSSGGSSSSSSSSSSGSSSSSSSSSGSNLEHWAYRMPDFYFKSKHETRCAPLPRTRLNAANKRGASMRRRVSNGFLRNSAKYATLPATATSLRKKAPIVAAEEDYDERGNQSDTEHCGSAVVRDYSDTEENNEDGDDKAI
jgi:ubiquitin carboxyl-terminal hydrolase 31